MMLWGILGQRRFVQVPVGMWLDPPRRPRGRAQAGRCHGRWVYLRMGTLHAAVGDASESSFREGEERSSLQSVAGVEKWPFSGCICSSDSATRWAPVGPWEQRPGEDAARGIGHRACSSKPPPEHKRSGRLEGSDLKYTISMAISSGNSGSFIALKKNREVYLDGDTEVISSFQAVITHLTAPLHPAAAPRRASDRSGPGGAGERRHEIICSVC